GAGRAARAILISDGLANKGDASAEGLLRRAGRATRGEYVLSAVGVGADFNEYLMTGLADAGTGNYYYLRSGTDLGEVFAREFDGARRTVASGLAIRIEPAPGVRVLDAAGYPLVQEGSAVTVRPGSLFAGQERRLWVTLAVPHDAVGTHGLGRFTLAYDDGHGRATFALAEEPRVACVADEEDFFASVDGPVWARSTLEEGYGRLQDEVAREVKAGRRDAATDLIRKYRAEASAMNDKVQSPAVTERLRMLGYVDSQVGAAFTGSAAEQAKRQNELSKTM